MKNIRHELALWIQTVGAIGVWVLLIYASDRSLRITWDAIRRLPEVVVIYGLLYVLFTRWLWRWHMFQGWLVPFPDLQGTWKGTLRSTWVDPKTGLAPDPIPVTFVVRQTFSSLSCAVYTTESSSFSTAASFQVDEDSEAKSVSYVYTNTPRVSVRDRSAVHDGAARLRVVTTPQLHLEGEYWTNRKSTGEMALTRATTRVAESFVE